MQTSLAAFVLLVLAAPVRCEVHTVGPPGSGADFSTIQAAIDAAAAGDTVLVAAGDYSGFSLAKSVAVMGAGSDKTKVTAIYPAGTSVIVSGIPAAEVAVVAGMSFGPAQGAFAGNCGIGLPFAEGTVVLHDVTSLGEAFGELEANRIPRLVLSRVSLQSDAFPGASLRGFSSRLWIVDSAVQKAPQLEFGWEGFSAARIVGSEVSFAGCRVVGSGVNPAWSLSGGNAIGLEQSHAVAGRTALLGADGATLGAGGFGAVLTGASTLFAAADAHVVGGLDGSGTTEQAPVSVEAGSTFVQGTAALPTLSASPAFVAAGDNLELVLYGEAGAHGALFVSLTPGAGASFPGLSGEVFLDLATPLPLGAIALDAAGEAHVTLAVPALPEPTLVTFQWAAISTVVEMSNPALVGVE